VSPTSPFDRRVNGIPVQASWRPLMGLVSIERGPSDPKAFRRSKAHSLMYIADVCRWARHLPKKSEVQILGTIKFLGLGPIGILVPPGSQGVTVVSPTSPIEPVGSSVIFLSPYLRDDLIWLFVPA
jgi:hypothetical protein